MEVFWKNPATHPLQNMESLPAKLSKRICYRHKALRFGSRIFHLIKIKASSKMEIPY
jgi:hypothetical protein